MAILVNEDKLRGLLTAALAGVYDRPDSPRGALERRVERIIEECKKPEKTP